MNTIPQKRATLRFVILQEPKQYHRKTSTAESIHDVEYNIFTVKNPIMERLTSNF
jgi:hypothetical protein